MSPITCYGCHSDIYNTAFIVTYSNDLASTCNSSYYGTTVTPYTTNPNLAFSVYCELLKEGWKPMSHRELQTSMKNKNIKWVQSTNVTCSQVIVTGIVCLMSFKVTKLLYKLTRFLKI